MSSGELTELIRNYVTSAEGYGRAIETGDAKNSDKYFDEVERAFKDLKREGRAGLEAISNLLKADNDGVTLWAAAHLLNYPEFNSVSVLERLSTSPSILAMTAEVTLDQWRNGQIKY